MDFETLLGAYLTWDHATVMSTFESPGSWPGDRPAPTTPAGQLAEVIVPIAEHAIWSARTNEAMAKLGLNFGPAYVWGRVAGLGDPPPEAVTAAMGVFAPRLVTAVYQEARRHCGRAGFLAAREEATVASLAEIIGDADVNEAVAVLRRGAEAADVCGRMLHAGVLALGWPDEPLGRLWRACAVLHEHRCDGHIVAWLAAGLSPVSANLLTELWWGLPLGLYTGMRRGWSETDIGAALIDLEARGLVVDGEITHAGRALREEIEERTDALMQPVVDAIGADLQPTVKALDEWSSALVAAGAFPSGAYRISSAAA